MDISITINIADIVHLVIKEVKRQNPDHELVGLTVKSWETEIFQVVAGTLVEPVRHHLRDDHRELTKGQVI